MSSTVNGKQITEDLLHDARLIGLVYEANGSIRLSFQAVGEVYVDIILIGVLRFAADHLLDGNIVLDVLSTSISNLDADKAIGRLKQAFNEEFATSPARRAQSARTQWEPWFEQIRKGDLQVLIVEPSYGAEIVAMCTGIKIEQQSGIAATPHP